MDNVRREFIIEVLETLKVTSGAFNVGTVADEIQHIPDRSLRAFHKALFGTQHSFLNGMDRIIKVAEQFKPEQRNEVELKAKELILLVESMSSQVYRDSAKYNIPFSDLMEQVKFPSLDKEDEAILNRVKPYQSLKNLVSNIRAYQTTKEQLQAFMNAIENHYEATAISSKITKMIGVDR